MTRTLPPHLVELLRACRELNTTETKALTRRLNLTPATVNVYFQRVAELLETTDRFSSVQQAFRLGLLVRYEENLLVNGDFTEGHLGDVPGNSMPWTTVLGWAALPPQTPQWVVTELEGGPAIQMWGAADTGEAIYQHLSLAHRIRAGKTYVFSAEYRFGPVRRDWPLTPRQPMFVDFVVRLSRGVLPSYAAPDTPGKIVTLGRLHYAPCPAENTVFHATAPSPEYLEHLRLSGGEELVQHALQSYRSGGKSFWPWEEGTLGPWTVESDYDTVTIHPTNDLVVGTDGSNPDAPNELAWGQIRRIRLYELTESGADAPG